MDIVTRMELSVSCVALRNEDGACREVQGVYAYSSSRLELSLAGEMFSPNHRKRLHAL